jgi:hypothetical protein
MKLLRSLGLLLCLAISNVTLGQTVDPTSGLQTTGNILDLGGGLPWTNTVTGAAGGFSGGSIPAYNSSTGNIIFGYTSQTVSQSISINQALATAGTGIQLAGYRYSWGINNELAGGSNKGTLIGNVSLTSSGGSILESYDYDYSQTNTATNAFQKFSGTQLFTNKYQLSTVDKITVSFTGQAQNSQTGYYGPRVHVNDVSLLYKTDPCVTNPAYSSTCAGFSNVLNTNNLLDSTKGGSSLNQAFAINTALENAGVGATVHGFNYGFNWRVGQGFSGCTAWNQDGSCSWTMNIPAYANATFSLTNSSNQTIHSKSYSFTGEGTNGSVSEKFLLPTSLNQSMLGTGRITGSASGTGSSIEGAWATMIYTADPCSTNPLYSPDCKGYAAAIVKQMSSSTSVAPSSLDPSDSLLDISILPSSSSGSTSDSINMQSQPTQQQSEPALASAPSSSTPVTSATPTANNPQPKPGEVQAAGSTGPSSLAMSVVASVRSRVGATERATVQQANEAAATATAQAVELAETVAGEAQSNSIASSSSNSSSTVSTSSTQTASVGSSLQSSSQSAVTSITVLKSYTPSSDTTATDNNESTSSMIGLDAPRVNAITSTQVTIVQQQQTEVQPLQATQPIQEPITMYQAPAQLIQNNVNYSLTEPSTFTFETGKKVEASVFTEVEIPKTDSFKMGTRSTLNDYLNEQPFMEMTGTEPTQDGMVKRNVQPNEAAGSVDIASIATQPKGYDVYAQMTLKDASFYKVEDIYKGQRTVDNVRLLRGLQRGSDRLHQDLVDQQYKLRK